MSIATRRISLGLFLVAFTAFGLIFSGVGNGNTVPRIAMTLAMVERGSFFIDEFAPFTDDKGEAHGHFISDKAPGLSFLALPAVAASVKVLHLLNSNTGWIEANPSDQTQRLAPKLKWVQWIATLSTSALFTALAVVVLFRTAMLLGASLQASLFAALVYGFATPTWGWATTFFSHAACGAFMVFALAAIVAATTPGSIRWPRARTLAVGGLAGLMLGATILLELTAAPAVIFIAVYGLWRVSNSMPDRIFPLIAAAFLGGLAAGAPYFLHNAILFSDPLSVGYSHSIAPEGFDGAAIDFVLPDPTIALKLLFGGGRGLLWLSPILILTPLAWLIMWRAGARAITLLCVSIFLAFLLVNAAYVNWYAGASTGPRYMAPALPFLALPFAWLWDRSGAVLRWTTGILAIVSMMLCFAMASIQMFAPWDYERHTARVENVVVDTLLPKLAKRQLPNLVATQMGASRQAATISYALLVGGGLLLLWLYASSLTLSRRM
jgi:hypothetical protein